MRPPGWLWSLTQASSCYVDFDARSKRTCMQLYVHEKFDSLSSHRRCAKILFWQRVQAKQGCYFGKGVQARRQEGSEIWPKGQNCCDVYNILWTVFIILKSCSYQVLKLIENHIVVVYSFYIAIFLVIWGVLISVDILHKQFWIENCVKFEISLAEKGMSGCY